MGRPVKLLLLGGGCALVASRLGLRQMLANPLKDPGSFARNNRLWRVGIANLLLLGGLGLVASAYLGSEGSKLALYKRH